MDLNNDVINLILLYLTNNYNGFTKLIEITKFSGKLLPKIINFKSERSQTLLHSACYRSDYNIITLLLINGIDINHQNYMNSTVLHYICYKNNLKILKLLLRYYPDINIRDRRGDTPLNRACRSTDSYQIVKLLLKSGARIDKNHKNRSPLFNAFLNYQYYIVNLLLRYSSSSISDICNCQRTQHFDYIIEGSCYYNCYYIINALINKYYYSTLRDSKGNTFLHYAVRQYNIPLVKFLLRKDCYMNYTNRNGQTPMDIAKDNIEISALFEK